MSAWIDTQGSSALSTVLSDLGRDLLSCRNDDMTAANATSLISKILGLTHVMVLRLVPAGDALLLQAGMGWEPGMVGHAIFDTDQNTLTGYALASSEPVTIENIQTETRFVIPTLLSGYGLASGLCIRIPCQYQAFGVLAAFSTEPRSFSQDERSCLQAVAGMLAVSSGCQRTGEVRREDQEKIAQAKQEWEATVDALPHFICLLDEQKHIVRANRSLEQWVPGPIGDVRGHTVHEVLHPGCHDPSCYMSTCDVVWNEVLSGRYAEFEVEDKVLKRHLSIQVRPTTRRPDINTKQTSLAVVVLQDITRIKFAEEVLKTTNDQLERLVEARTSELIQANEQLKCEIMERQRIEEELRHSENEMRLLSVQLLTVQEMERKRIASELHDGIGQSLSAMKFCLENAIGRWPPQPDNQDVDRIKGVIPKMQASIDEVRRIAMDLRPSTLDDLGIIPTIAWFCREFRSIYNDIHLDTHIAVAENDVSVPLKTVIFRIMQEALNNVVRHARARHVRVHLRKTDSAIELLVRDNGIGFDVNSQAQRKKSSRGFGITGMRERAEFSGGTFLVTSNSAAGTVVRVAWPCQH
jgi:signal transduction histidine kinase